MTGDAVRYDWTAEVKDRALAATNRQPGRQHQKPKVVERQEQAFNWWETVSTEGLYAELVAHGLQRVDVVTADEIADLFRLPRGNMNRRGGGIGEIARLVGGSPPPDVFRVMRQRYYLFDDAAGWVAPYLERRHEKAEAVKLRELDRKARWRRRQLRVPSPGARNPESGFHGVRLFKGSKSKLRRPWAAMINVPGENRVLHLGYSATPEEAARLYDRARLHFGFSAVNFPFDVDTTMQLPPPRLKRRVMITDCLRAIIDQHGPLTHHQVYDKLVDWDPQPDKAYTPASLSSIIHACLIGKGEVVRTVDGYVLAGRGEPAPRTAKGRPTSFSAEERRQIADECRTESQRNVAKRHGTTPNTIRRIRQEFDVPTFHHSRGKTSLKRHPEKTIKAAVDAYAAGATAPEVAARYGIAESTLQTWAKEAGVSKKADAARWSNEDRAKVVAAYEAGEPLKAIADRLGCDRKTVRNWVRQAGGEIRQPGRPRSVVDEPAGAAEPAMPAAAPAVAAAGWVLEAAQWEAMRRLAERLPNEYEALYREALAELTGGS